MYIEFFGLEQNPFRARASGASVFVGPQQAKMFSALKKALGEPDAVAAVSGPVGVGKTISVIRAMDSLSSQKSIARIGRMQLGREEILELLLDEFGVGGQANGTLQRFGAFKRLLNDSEDNGVRVFIVVEDATRIGVDALAELESLSSADSGETGGANLILMGPPDLNAFLKTPPLARLNQRIRLRHFIEPFTLAEIRGYVAHRIREAGGDFDALFAPDAIDAVHRCSGGIPRVVNGICVAALTAAADAKSTSISARLIERIAGEEFGFEADHAPSVTAPDEAGPMQPQAGREDHGNAPEATPASPIAAAQTEETTDRADTDVPELIQDTLPSVKALKLDGPEPSSSALDAANGATPTEPDVPKELNAAAMSAEERRVMLEPRAPEPLSKTLDPADTQTIKALDSALRPDTQLLEALEEPVPAPKADKTVPNDPASGGPAPSADALQEPGAGEPASSAGTEKLPTLSDSMRLAPPPAAAPDTPSASVAADTKGGEAKKPDIDALETALAVARKGPMDLGDDTASPATAAAAPQPTAAEPDPATSAETVEPRDAAESVPEITLDDSIRRQQEAAQARLAEEAAKVAAAAKAEQAPEKSEAELAAEKELVVEKERLAGMSSIAEQFSSAEELSLADLGSATKPAAGELSLADSGSATEAAVPVEQNTEQADDDRENREKLKQLAAELGSATSLEDIDDLAAETLFGEEFSQMAATVAAMAANDTSLAVETKSEPKRATPEAAPAPPAVELELESPAPTKPAQLAPSPAAGPAATTTAPPAPRRPIPDKPEIDPSAARRLEMVRSLNKKRPPPANAPTAEDIVLGDADQVPVGNAPKPEPIENQFGTSMTANLEALNVQSVEAMQNAEEQEKKGGLLSRFKRS